jgi:hypothetical protein
MPMEAARNDPFFRVPRANVTTSEGDAELPILYYDVSALLALFAIDHERAAVKLEGMGLVPGLGWGKKAIAALAFYEYRETSIGPYNEAALALAACPCQMAKFGGWFNLYGDIQTRRVGFHILNLPVTTRIACAGGIELWGYPKFITQIPFKLEKTAFDAFVMDPDNDQVIVRLNGELGLSLPAPPLSLVLYSQLDNRMLRSTVNVRGRVRLRGGGGLRVTVGDSDHDMAKNLRDLHLDGARPLFVMDTHRFQSRLNLGEEIYLA